MASTPTNHPGFSSIITHTQLEQILKGHSGDGGGGGGVGSGGRGLPKWSEFLDRCKVTTSSKSPSHPFLFAGKITNYEVMSDE